MLTEITEREHHLRDDESEEQQDDRFIDSFDLPILDRTLQLHPLLSHEETIKLAEIKDNLYRQGVSGHERKLGQEAFDRLVQSNLRLVISLSKRYSGKGVSDDDLFQEGVIGLMTAVRKFDPARGFRFSTYASNWIISACQRAVHAQGSPIRLTHSRYEQTQRLRRTQRKLTASLGRSPSKVELADALGIDDRELERLLLDMERPRSLNNPLRNGDGEMADLVEERHSSDPAVLLVERSHEELLESALGRLPAEQALIIRERFGMGSGEPRTLRELATVLGHSRDQIRMLEAAALEQLAEDLDLQTLSEAGQGHPLLP